MRPPKDRFASGWERLVNTNTPFQRMGSLKAAL